MPIGGSFSVVIYDTLRYGFASLYSEVVEVEGAFDPTTLSVPATEDTFAVIPPPDPDAPVPPRHEFTLLDAGPNLFSTFGDEMFTYAKDPESGEYSIGFLMDQPLPDASAPATFIIPAVGDVPETTFAGLIDVEPLVLAADGVVEIPNPAAPIDVTWTGVPSGARINIDVFAITEGNFQFVCAGSVVDDGAFTVPAECILAEADFLSIGSSTSLDALVEYDGRRVKVEGRWQTQVDLAPPEEPEVPALASRRMAASACFASARAFGYSQPNPRRAIQAAGSKCAAQLRAR